MTADDAAEQRGGADTGSRPEADEDRNDGEVIQMPATAASGGTSGTVALDLGGVLLSDGTKTGFSKLAAHYGGDRQHLAEYWHSQLRIPAELGHATAQQTMTALADAAGGPVEQVEELFLNEFQPIPEGVEYLQQAHKAGVRVLLATNPATNGLNGGLPGSAGGRCSTILSARRR